MRNRDRPNTRLETLAILALCLYPPVGVGTCNGSAQHPPSSKPWLHLSLAYSCLKVMKVKLQLFVLAILQVVSLRSWTTIGDIVGAALVVITLASNYTKS